MFGAASNWIGIHSQVTWHANHILHVLTGFKCEPRLAAAAPISSNVAINTAFLPLALSPCHFSQCGVFKGRPLATVEAQVDEPATRYQTVVSPAHQAGGRLIEGSTKR
jgi:hypothetical protein